LVDRFLSPLPICVFLVVFVCVCVFTHTSVYTHIY
jgi:hypothetical protein